MKTFCEKLVAQVSKPAVSPISESACVENSGGRRLSEGLQLRKPAIQQTWNSALLPLSLQQSVFIRVNPWLKLCFAAALAFTASIAFAAEPLSENLQKGLFEEEANHNLEAAIKAYQSVVDQSQEQRRIAATALFRLGECSRKLNKTNDAAGYYKRLLREFPEQSALTTLSEQNLVALNASAPSGAMKASETATDAEAQALQRIKAIIRDSPDLINGIPAGGKSTPLQDAAELGQLTVARFLLANNADVNARDWSKATALHRAADKGHKSMVELLLANGADVNAVGEYAGIKDCQPLHLAVNRGYRSVVDILLAHKADVNATTADRRTPFYFAAERGFVELAKILLSKGADANIANNAGYTPIWVAAGSSRADMVRLLLEHKPEVNRMAAGHTPLHRAILSGSTDVTRLLLDNGADINVKGGPQQSSSVHMAVEARSSEMLKLLLGYKPILELADNNGYTPLEIALAKPDLQIAEMLLQAGANPNTIQRENSNSPFTLLSYVLWQKQPKIVELLLQYKADPNLRAGNEPPLVTAIHQSEGAKGAEKERWDEIADLLRKHGADENIGRANYISYKRPGWKTLSYFYTRDPSGHNTFTLFQFIASLYQRLGATEDYTPEKPINVALPEFPDFSKIVIERLSDQRIERIPVDVATALAKKDCSKDAPLQWGDVVEIPEQDHPLNEKWNGLADDVKSGLKDCLDIGVDIIIHAGSTKWHHIVSVAPWEKYRVIDNKIYLPYTRLNKVLSNSGLLRSSSDLSRVEVERKTNNQTETMYFDLRPQYVDSAKDLVLRNHDTIIIYEKQ